jgi:hypothetical protein
LHGGARGGGYDPSQFNNLFVQRTKRKAAPEDCFSNCIGPSYNLHRKSRWVVSNTLYCFQHPAAEGSREACKPCADPTSLITRCEDTKTRIHAFVDEHIAVFLAIVYHSSGENKRGMCCFSQENLSAFAEISLMARLIPLPQAAAP